MGVNQARQNPAAPQVYQPGLSRSQRPDVVVIPDGQNAIAAHSYGRRVGTVGVLGVQLAIIQN